MANEIETFDSENEEQDIDLELDNEEEKDISALKEKYQKLSDTNKQLYARAKKAEGFELKDGKWVKPEKVNTKEVVTAPEKEPTEKSGDLDYGQKAFLRSYDIKGADELALVKNWMNRTGDDLDTMVDDTIFQAKLQGLRDAKRDAKAVADATPKNSRRPSIPTQNDEAYWVAKIASGDAKLIDIEDVILRRKVLNKQVEIQKSGDKFSSNSVVLG